MKIRKAYKFRLKTNEEIEKSLWTYVGHCRFIWNYFWRLNQERLLKRQRIMRYYEMDFWSKLLKQSEEYGFLGEAPSQALQQKLKDLDRAYTDGFDRKQPHKRLPTQRKKQIHSSFRLPTPSQFPVVNRRIKLPKIGWISFHKSQEIQGNIKNITISHHSGHWYASIQVEQEIVIREDNIRSCVGIDVGIAKFATLATEGGHHIYDPRNAYRRLEEKIQREQRKLKHKKKFSSNWIKQRRRIQKQHAKVSHTRHDHLHKISTEICKNHAVIFVEDLKVANMSKSAKGTTDEPGRNVRAKSGLNKSILDQGWHKFRTLLAYKSMWQGGDVIAIPPQYTSQTCSSCGERSEKNRQSQESFVCTKCSYAANADINAARNILAAGLGRVGL